MWYYKIYGLYVESDYPLKSAYLIERPSVVQVQIHHEEMSEEYLVPTQQELESKYSCITHMEKDWICTRSAGQGTFIVRKGNEIGYFLFEQYDSEYVENNILCYCMPLLALQREMLLLHGSGIFYNGKSLIISGESGAGKSTLANEIISRNFLQMADDSVAIDKEEDGKFYAYATFPLRKLCADMVEKTKIDKSRLIRVIDIEREKYGLLLKDEYYSEKADLGAMVVIKVGEVQKPILKEIIGSEKLKYIIENLYTKGFFEQVKVSSEILMKAVKIADNMSVYSLIRPKGQMTTKEQADLIEKEIIYKK